jgi:hypothetical protein
MVLRAEVMRSFIPVDFKPRLRKTASGWQCIGLRLFGFFWQRERVVQAFGPTPFAAYQAWTLMQ